MLHVDTTNLDVMTVGLLEEGCDAFLELVAMHEEQLGLPWRHERGYLPFIEGIDLVELAAVGHRKTPREKRSGVDNACCVLRGGVWCVARGHAKCVVELTFCW